MKRKLITVLMAVAFLLGSSVSAYAYVLHTYKLIGGIYQRYYTVPSNATYTFEGQTEWYGSIIRDSVDRWNARVDWMSDSQPENLWFLETDQLWRSQVDYYVEEYGNIGWRGVTEFFNGGQLCPTGDWPNQDWTWCKVKLNVSQIHFDSYNVKFGHSAHEFGHTLGLKHSNTTMSVMYWDWTKMQTVPTSDDEAGIRAKY